jgi:D-amino-acid dehydrogenase
MSNRRAVVVGGGVIGTACAHYLATFGWEVMVLDRGEHGHGCSHGNCGLIAHSHILPLAAPGAVGTSLRSLLSKNAPFRIALRYDPGLWIWLLKFALRCNKHDMLEAAKARAALLDSSRKLFDELMADEPLECEWESRGCLFVYQTLRAWQRFSETDKLVRENFGLSAVRYSASEVIDFEPVLKPEVAGGWYYQLDSHLRPDRLMSSWCQLLRNRGVEVRPLCEVKGFTQGPRGARAVVTDLGEIPAEVFVIAAGSQTPWMNRHLGCQIPIQPGKGYSITMPRPKQCPSLPLLFPEHHVVATPMQSGYRLGSTMEFSGYDDTINHRRLETLKEGASHYLQQPHGEPVHEMWYGWRPMTFDGIPVIDRCPAMNNVLIAAGHNMLGLSMAPATGKLVAELLSDTQPHLDPAPYSLKRF